jgi:hypothetical protein
MPLKKSIFIKTNNVLFVLELVANPYNIIYESDKEKTSNTHKKSIELFTK